jgi:hypothetical protein
MPEKRIPADAHDDGGLPPHLEDDVVDRGILGLLLNSEGPGLWLTEELALEVGDQLATVDSLTRLYAAGLIHRCQDFVFATRAAIQFDALAEL